MPPRQDRRHDRHQGREAQARDRARNVVLDTVVAAETPEGILLELRPAGLSARFYAFLLDWLIRLAIIYAAAIALAVAGRHRRRVLLILLFALEWFYPVVFELTPLGRDAGQARVRAEGRHGQRPAGDAGGVVRRATCCASPTSCRSATASRIVSMLMRPRRQAARRHRRGDARRPRAATARQESRSTRVPPLAPARPLAPEDQAAVIALAARAPRLTAERLDELAALAAPVSGDAGRAGPARSRGACSASRSGCWDGAA